MNGILAVNHFLNGKKFNEMHSHLVKAAQASGIELEIKTNLHLATESCRADFVLFWDKDINLARRIEIGGIPVFNSADSIAKCDDKARTYAELLNTVPQPETLAAPKTFFKSDMREFVEKAVEILGLPVVFKECFGSFGEQVYLCKSKEEVLEKISEKPFVLQKFIAESCGEDVRIEVIDGKCVCAVKRINKNDFRSNVTNGGKMIPYEPTEYEKSIAQTACNKLGLTFGGVDILNHSLVCEVNSNAHIMNMMNTTGIDIAPLIFSSIREKIT